ncbi:hypothetical protein [Bacillus thuringiensis]|uniref:hypothetical protein n=1 Tax=Bacillus thuringiensis TaxID=1428 RepID=UPI000BF72A3A|nr:hypothetical protein [Bacillus thuringiensis]PEV64081.1 hypothetical protein CN434_25070 [Bacillus thuringiensis]
MKRQIEALSIALHYVWEHSDDPMVQEAGKVLEEMREKAQNASRVFTDGKGFRKYVGQDKKDTSNARKGWYQADVMIFKREDNQC